MTTQEELKLLRIAKLDAFRLSMLSTVDSRDNSFECWIECVNDAGEKVRLIPDMTGRQDRLREVLVMNTTTGKNQKLYFEEIWPHSGFWTLNEPRANYAVREVTSSLPSCVIDWAVMRAK